MDGDRRVRALCVVAAVLVLTLTAAACGGGGREAGGTELRVGYAFGFDPGDVGGAVGFDTLERERGITASFQEMGGSRNGVIALERGDIDVGVLSLLDVAQAIDQGADLRVVLPTNTLAEFVLVGGRGIDSADDLPGQEVAVYAVGDLTNAVATTVLEQAGVPGGDVRFLGLPESTNRTAALVAGEVGAAVVDYVDYLHLAGESPAFTLLGGVGATPSFPTSAYVVSGELARNSPELIQEIVSGLLDGYESLYGPDGEQLWTAKATATALAGESPELVRRMYAFYRDNSFWPRRAEPLTQEAYDRGAQFWVDSGQIERVVPFEQVWDTSFWQEAASG